MHELQSSGSAACRRRHCNSKAARAVSSLYLQSISCPLRCLPRDEPSARPLACPSTAHLAEPQSPRNYGRARQVRGGYLAGTAHRIIRYQHSTPLIDASSMPIVTKLAPSPPCDGCHAPRGAAKSSNRARSFCTLAPSSAPGPNPSCIHYRRVAVGAQATLSPSPLPHPHRQR